MPGLALGIHDLDNAWMAEVNREERINARS